MSTTDIISGTLSDEDILRFCEKNILIADGFCEKNIRQSCYELRASKVYYDLSIRNHPKIQVKDEEYILLKPKHHMVIITEEYLKLPSNMLGRILTKGKLFSIGILPVNTYADPGFEGNLGIVLFNLSNNYIKLNPGEPIAKIEFSKLQNAVLNPYKGQHGYQTQIWPIPSEMILSEEEIKKDWRIKSDTEEIELAQGKLFSEAIIRVDRYGKYIVGATLAYVFFSMLLVSALMYMNVNMQEVINPLLGILSGVVSNAIFATVTCFAFKKGT